MDRNTIPHVFALSFGADEYICCVYINGYNKKEEWTWPELNTFERKFLNSLDKFKPHIVIVSYCGAKTKLLFMHVKRIVRIHNENQFETTTDIIIADSKVASEEVSKACPKSTNGIS